MEMECGKGKGHLGPGDRVCFTNVVRSALLQGRWWMQVDIYLQRCLAGKTVNLETGLHQRARPHPSPDSSWLGVPLGR